MRQMERLYLYNSASTVLENFGDCIRFGFILLYFLCRHARGRDIFYSFKNIFLLDLLVMMVHIVFFDIVFHSFVLPRHWYFDLHKLANNLTARSFIPTVFWRRYRKYRTVEMSGSGGFVPMPVREGTHSPAGGNICWWGYGGCFHDDVFVLLHVHTFIVLIIGVFASDVCDKPRKLFDVLGWLGYFRARYFTIRWRRPSRCWRDQLARFQDVPRLLLYVSGQYLYGRMEYY